MTSRCSNSTCINGNCIGCKNGSKYCNDPRCYPNCPDCSGETSVNCVSRRDSWDWVLIVIIAVLSIIALILIGLMAWGWYNPDDETSTENNSEWDMEYQDGNQDEGRYEPPMAAQAKYRQPDVLPVLPETPPRPKVSPPPVPSYSREIDASLNVPVGGMPPPEVLPEMPPIDLGRTPSVASAQPPPIPYNTMPENDGIIRGF